MPDLSELLASWQDLRWVFDPALATRAGVEAHAGRLPGLDAESIKMQVAGLKSLAGAVELLDLDDDGDEIDRTALLDVLRAESYRLESELPQRRNPALWLGALADAFQSLRAHPLGSPAARAQWALERLEETPAFIERAGKGLKNSAAVYVEEAVALAPAVRDTARRLASEAAQWLPGLTDRLSSAAHQAELAIAGMEHRLREDVNPSAEPSAYAIDREAYEHRLHFEHALRPSSSELWRWSQHLLDETRKLAVEAAVAVGLGDDLHKAAKSLRAAHPAGDVQATVLRALARARKWVEGAGVMPIGAVELRVLEMPDHLALLGGQVRFEADDVVYIRGAAGSHPQSAPELLVEVLYELCPGRMSHRNVARALPDPVRRALVTPCAVDGWALYALDLAIETGFVTDPAEVFAIRLAQLRAVARGVVDLGLHTEGFTPTGAVEMLIQLLPIERDEALADVRRACGWPTYSLAAAVGRREIVELRGAWAQAHPSLRSGQAPRTGAQAHDGWSAFHAELLQFGGLPVSLSRWGMDLGLEE